MSRDLVGCCCVCAVTIIFHIQPKNYGPFFYVSFRFFSDTFMKPSQNKPIQIQSKARRNINFNSLELCCCACIYLCHSVVRNVFLQLNIGLYSTA